MTTDAPDLQSFFADTEATPDEPGRLARGVLALQWIPVVACFLSRAPSRC